MQTYIEETLAFIELTEMREYMLEYTDKLDGHDYAKIVAYAPAPIERKIPVLDLIAEQSGYTDDYYNPVKIACMNGKYASLLTAFGKPSQACPYRHQRGFLRNMGI